MSLTGIVQQGVIVVENGCQLPEGTRVEIVVPNTADPPTDAKPSLLSFLKLAGTAKNLPADFAEQHDHYIHGTPRR